MKYFMTNQMALVPYNLIIKYCNSIKKDYNKIINAQWDKLGIVELVTLFLHPIIL